MEEMTWEEFKKNMARYEAEERESMGVKAFLQKIAHDNMMQKQSQKSIMQKELAFRSNGPSFFEQHCKMF